jgi:hypothetical protein
MGLANGLHLHTVICDFAQDYGINVAAVTDKSKVTPELTVVWQQLAAKLGISLAEHPIPSLGAIPPHLTYSKA